MLSIVLLATVITIILFSLYPIVLEMIFNKRSEREKYYQISNSDESAFGNILINSYLNYLPDELSLLSPLCNVIDKADYERAAKFGCWSSSILLRMGNHLLRCINGLYTMYALEQWEQQISGKTARDRIEYIRYGVLINDLGWSLYKLTDTQHKRLLAFLKEHGDQFEAIIIAQNLLHTAQGHRAYAETHMKQLLQALRDKKNLSLLRCQALRHLLSFDSTAREAYHQYASEFAECIKAIPGRRDKIEMNANYAFWSAQRCLIHGESEKATKSLRKAGDLYKSIKNDYRLVKTFYLQGQIYERLAEAELIYERKKELLELAFKAYSDGVAESESIARYDEYIKNCYAAVNVAIAFNANSAKYQRFKEKGLRASRLLRNETMEVAFECLHHSKHIILLRHGESEKNIKKIINGSGSLTDQGRSLVAERAREISDYLSVRGLTGEQISIYGHSIGRR